MAHEKTFSSMYLPHALGKIARLTLDSVAFLRRISEPERPIIWSGPWFRDAHNNVRYASLLSRFDMVEARVEFRTRNDRRGRLRRRYEQSLLGKYWHRGVWYPHQLHVLGKMYKMLFCTGYLEQIRHFPGPVIVDDDDPEITPRRIEKLNRSNVVAVVTTTELLRDELIKEGLDRACHVIPSGVDFSGYDAQKVADIGQQLGKNPDDTVIGYTTPYIYTDSDPEVMRSHEAKLRSISFLITVMEKVWKKLPDVKLWLIGHPSESVRSYAAAHTQVRLLGYIPHHMILNYMANYDIAVYPRPVGFAGRHSIKLLEYMACEIPIVATSVPEAFLVTESGAGLLASGVEEFAECIFRLCEDENRNSAYGRQGLMFAREYDWNVLAKRYEAEVFQPYLEAFGG